MIKKISILFLGWFVLELLQNITFESNLKFDIYLLYDYPNNGRYISNIFYDLSAHYAWIILTYSLFISLNSLKSLKSHDINVKRLIMFAPYVRAVFFWRILELILYFLFCNQTTNLISFPFLITFIILIYAKNRKNT